jgi:hypothetical protein
LEEQSFFPAEGAELRTTCEPTCLPAMVYIATMMADWRVEGMKEFVDESQLLFVGVG